MTHHHQINRRDSTSLLSPLPLLKMQDTASTFTSTSTTSPSSRPSQRSYLHTGVGGAGNYHKFTPAPPYLLFPPSSLTTSNMPSSVPVAPRQPPNHHRSNLRSLFRSGIGGAGNVYSASNAASLSEEEYARMKMKTMNDQPSGRWSVGIGGAGNRREGVVMGKVLPEDRSLDGGGSLLENGSGGSGCFGGERVPIGLAEVLKRRIGSVLGMKGRRGSLEHESKG